MPEGHPGTTQFINTGTVGVVHEDRRAGRPRQGRGRPPEGRLQGAPSATGGGDTHNARGEEPRGGHPDSKRQVPDRVRRRPEDARRAPGPRPLHRSAEGPRLGEEGRLPAVRRPRHQRPHEHRRPGLRGQGHRQGRHHHRHLREGGLHDPPREQMDGRGQTRHSGRNPHDTRPRQGTHARGGADEDDAPQERPSGHRPVRHDIERGRPGGLAPRLPGQERLEARAADGGRLPARQDRTRRPPWSSRR